MHSHGTKIEEYEEFNVKHTCLYGHFLKENNKNSELRQATSQRNRKIKVLINKMHWHEG